MYLYIELTKSKTLTELGYWDEYNYVYYIYICADKVYPHHLSSQCTPSFGGRFGGLNYFCVSLLQKTASDRKTRTLAYNMHAPYIYTGYGDSLITNVASNVPCVSKNIMSRKIISI